MELSRRVLRLGLLSGARQAEGLTVVIDVLRAFTCAAFMAHLGAEKIILLAEPEAVLRLKQEKDYLAVGEVGGRPVPGFDLGNSPTRILAAGRRLFAGRAVAQRTSAGVAGAVAAARRAGPGGPVIGAILLGSYVTAAAIARHIQTMTPPPQTISLVAMGSAGREATPDDEGCADYLDHLLTGRLYNHAATLQQIVEHECTQKFLRGSQAHFPPADPVYCLQRDLFDFVLAARLESGLLVARRIDIPAEQQV